ncbi:MAG: M50 family metallopeptidase [Dehalococcoidales bacterium]|nr:M50 family metallopeptidase [Dehalococcoidales bacterium]
MQQSGEVIKDKGNPLQEILEFAISVVWLGIAFGIAFAGGTEAFKDFAGLRTAIIESLIVVFFAFVFHELSHRIIARRYGYKAVYHVWIPGLLLALVAALVGFLFAAPGGVLIEMRQDSPENRVKNLGKSALAGPIANIILAFIFAILSLALVYFLDFYLLGTGKTFSQVESTVNLLWGIFSIGVELNAWLAVFNLLPFGAMDGYKVFQWNRKVWTIAFVGAIGLYFLMPWGISQLVG